MKKDYKQRAEKFIEESKRLFKNHDKSHVKFYVAGVTDFCRRFSELQKKKNESEKT